MAGSLDPEVVHLEDCTVEIRGYTCCGVDHWYAKLPDGRDCCEAASHLSRENAILCARKALRAGLRIPLARVTEAG